MPITRNSIIPWVEEALRALGGRGTPLAVCKKIWEVHQAEIEQSGDLFYRWQFEIHWAANVLRRRGAIRPANQYPRRLWELE